MTILDAILEPFNLMLLVITLFAAVIAFLDWNARRDQKRHPRKR